MTALQVTGARIVVPSDAPKTVWMLERGEGPTASVISDIAHGGIKTWRRVLEQMMNGSTFRGNRATRAGHEREAALLDEAADQLHRVSPNGALWASAENDLHRATPDGIGVNPDGSIVTVEVKSHEHGYQDKGIPRDHMEQMQWQMHVLGAVSALYGYEIRDKDDQPPADGAKWIDVERDDEMIAFLVYRADLFIAWRDAGCPNVDNLPDDVAAALDEWAPLKAELDELTGREKKAAAALKKAIAESMPHAERFGAVGIREAGGFQVSVSEKTVLDEDAWAAESLVEYRSWLGRKEQAEQFVEFMKREHPKTVRTPSLKFQKVEESK